MKGIWIPLRTTVIPASRRTRSNNVGYLLSRTRMRILDPAPGIFEVHHQVTGGLRQPGRGRVRGCAEDLDAAAGMLDHGEDVHPGTSERDGLDEVRRQQRLGLRTKKLRPGRGGAVWSRIDPRLAPHLPDRRRGNPHPEGQQLAAHSPISPRRVLRHQTQHQRAKRTHDSRPTPPPSRNAIA
jgi:hypothetical protein